MAPVELAERVRAGDRRALAQAITLAESTLLAQRSEAEQLLAILVAGGAAGDSHRVALTGPPGAGKSTLLDALGGVALAAGRRVAVLAVDPASAISGGSLLGDAVRMQRLTASDRAFVRASSNAGTLGGTAPGTREAILLCEAAGFDFVLIETVGVGQAEQDVHDLCDTLLVLNLAGSGDEVQGMKRGLLEVADAVLINKADGAGQPLARAFALDLARALELLRPGSLPHVAALSAMTGSGVPELCDWLNGRELEMRHSGVLLARRQQQLARAFRSALSRELLLQASGQAATQQLLPELEAAVVAGAKLPRVAARELSEALLVR